MSTRSRLVNLPEAAAQLATPLPTVRRWVAQRRIATVKIGRRVLVEQSEIDRLIEASRRPAMTRPTPAPTSRVA